MSALSVLHVVSLMLIQVGSRGFDYDIATFSGIFIGFSFAIGVFTILQYLKSREAGLLLLGLWQAVVPVYLLFSDSTMNSHFSMLVLATTGLLALLLLKSFVVKPGNSAVVEILFITGYLISALVVLSSAFPALGIYETMPLVYFPVIAIIFVGILLFLATNLERKWLNVFQFMVAIFVVLAIREMHFSGYLPSFFTFVDYTSLWVTLLVSGIAYTVVLKIGSGTEAKRSSRKSEPADTEDRLKQEYVAMVAHEIRSPLAGITGISDLLMEGAEGELSPDVKRNLELISSSSKRLTFLLNDLLDVSRIRENILEYKPKPVHLRSVVSRVMALQYSKASSKGVELRNQVAKSLPNVMVDIDKLEQVLHNLINNSVKFTDEGYVSVDADLKDGEILLTIEDTGQGLSKEHIDRLLQSFDEDLTKPAPSTSGTGLGLKITNKLIALMGSSLVMESAQGFGSYFSFTLPITDESADVNDQYDNYTISKRDSTRPLTHIMPHRNARISEKYKIMIIDDEPVNIKVLSAQLSRAGYEIISFHDGREALNHLKNQQIPDLILLDIMMPNMNGFEVCTAIRQEFSQTELPVILLTAKSHTSDILQGFKHGANDYIAKPIAKDELLVRIKTHVELSKINHAFSRFVPHEFLRFLGYDSVMDIKLGDQVQKNMTVMFSDIKDFTRLSENMTPKEAFDFINTFLGVVSPLIRRSGGFIDKFIGDAVMALFPGGADDALKAAILITEELKKLNKTRGELGLEPIQIGTGLHTGELMLGTIGEEMRMEGPVISDVVNTASRLEGLTKVFDNNVIISSDTLDALNIAKMYHFRYLGKTRVKGKNNILDVYGVIEGDDEVNVKLEKASAEAFEAGIKDFYNKNFTRASVNFNEVLKIHPGDKAASIFLKRSAHLMVNGVPKDWSGVDEGSIILEQLS